jgi:hypothetical protein
MIGTRETSPGVISTSLQVRVFMLETRNRMYLSVSGRKECSNLEEGSTNEIGGGIAS